MACRSGARMNCKEFEHRIPEFLNQTLDYRYMEAFREHMEKCDSCREELTIQFLVTEGIKHLENDGDFDLDAELGRLLEQNNKNLRFHQFRLSSRRYMITTALILVGMALIFQFG